MELDIFRILRNHELFKRLMGKFNSNQLYH